jgi:hypothetical protein
VCLTALSVAQFVCITSNDWIINELERMCAEVVVAFFRTRSRVRL